jgi:hypothetical protein
MVQGRTRALLIALTVALLALPAGTAWGGRLFATGHDADSHCVSPLSGDTPQGQCHFVAVAVNYVRASAPTPSRPLLLLDCTRNNQLRLAINTALGPTSSTTMCPSTDADFRRTNLSTASYSAIVVGSSGDMININSINTTPDSVAINARAGDFSAFFNQGGGVLALSGDYNADGVDVPPDTYYRFIPVPLGGKLVNAPFVLTPAGQGLGLQDSHNGIGTSDDINCCPTHNSFQEPPAGSLLQVAERDRVGAPESLFAEGIIGAGTIVAGPSTGQIVSAPSKCLRRRKLRIKIRQPGNSRISRATLYVNGKRKRTLKRKRFGNKRVVSVVLRKLPKTRIIRVKIVVRTTQGVRHKITKRYKRCAKSRKRR